MVKFETKFNSETTKALNKAAFKKLIWLFVLMSILLIVVGIVDIIGGIQGADDGSLPSGIFKVLFGLFFFPLVLLLTKIMQSNLDKSMSLLSDETREKFVFTQDGIEIETEQPGMYSSRVTTTYKYLYKIVDTKDVLYLYISKAQSHVIQKKYLTEGSHSELLNYFEANFNRIKGKMSATVYSNKR